ncbi:MAG: hypothetical protein WC483_02175 [Candidatus Paceibacterota bacterium]
MAETKNVFPGDLIPAGELSRRLGPSPSKPTPGRFLIMDYPIKSIDRFIANACTHMAFANYVNFGFTVANEGAAVVAALLAAGYTPREIYELRASGKFIPIDLIEAKTKITGRFHVQKKGADHKGLRFREAVDRLIREKIGAGPGVDPLTPVSFAELAITRPVAFYITALDLTTGAVVTLSRDTHPTMAVADAVLASCAVQPYLRNLTFTDAVGPHLYAACSNIATLPFLTAQGKAKEKRIPNFDSLAIGYGCSSTANEAGVKNASGTATQKALQAQRAQAVVPAQLMSHFIMF